MCRVCVCLFVVWCTVYSVQCTYGRIQMSRIEIKVRNVCILSAPLKQTMHMLWIADCLTIKWMEMAWKLKTCTLFHVLETNFIIQIWLIFVPCVVFSLYHISIYGLNGVSLWDVLCFKTLNNNNNNIYMLSFIRNGNHRIVNVWPLRKR